MVTPNPEGGGPRGDGNWHLAYPYPSEVSQTHGPCALKNYIPAWVDTPNHAWMPDSASSESEWITPFDGEGPQPLPGWYVYRTWFPVPAALPDGSVPSGVTINGHLASDNATYTLYLESPASSGACSIVAGQPFPINPAGSEFGDFAQWWDFSFTNSVPLTPGTGAYLYIVMLNAYDLDFQGGVSPTGLRVEFFSSSAFH